VRCVGSGLCKELIIRVFVCNSASFRNLKMGGLDRISAVVSLKVKVKQSCYRPVVAQRVPGS